MCVQDIHLLMGNIGLSFLLDRCEIPVPTRKYSIVIFLKPSRKIRLFIKTVYCGGITRMKSYGNRRRVDIVLVIYFVIIYLNKFKFNT